MIALPLWAGCGFSYCACKLRRAMGKSGGCAPGIGKTHSARWSIRKHTLVAGAD